MDNVIDLEDVRRQNRDDKERNVLDAMWQGLENSKWKSLSGLAAEAANQQPLWYLHMLVKHCVEPPTQD